MNDIDKAKIINAIAKNIDDSDESTRLILRFIQLIEEKEKQQVREIIKEISTPCPYAHFPNYGDHNGTGNPLVNPTPIWLVDLNNPIVVH